MKAAKAMFLEDEVRTNKNLQNGAAVNLNSLSVQTENI